MGRKLNTNVHLLDSEGLAHSFGPDDDVPAWAVDAITNESVWADSKTADTDDDDTSNGDVPAPPRRGRPPKDRTPDQGE